MLFRLWRQVNSIIDILDICHNLRRYCIFFVQLFMLLDYLFADCKGRSVKPQKRYSYLGKRTKSMNKINLCNFCRDPRRYFIPEITLPIKNQTLPLLPVDMRTDDAPEYKIDRVNEFVICKPRNVPHYQSGLFELL